MKVITATFTLNEPVLLPNLVSDSGRLGSLDFLRGDYVLAAFASAFERSNEGYSAKLFRDGGIRFGNAYPLTSKGEETNPTPASYRVDKDHPTEAYDLASDHPANKDLRRLRGGFLAANHSYVVGMRTATHNVRPREDAVESNPFRYTAIESRQRFRGEIFFEKDETEQSIRRAAAEDLFFGVSKDAEYGWITVEMDEAWDLKADDELPSSGTWFIFASDALLRDANGAFRASKGAIAWALGLEESDIEEAFLDSVEIAGSSGAWRMPIEQAQAVAKGTVVKLGRSPTWSLYELAYEGIGARTEAGFGRLERYDPAFGMQVISRAELGRLLLEPAEEKVVSEFSDFVRRLREANVDALIDGLAVATKVGGKSRRSAANRIRCLALDAEDRILGGEDGVKYFLDQIERVCERDRTKRAYNELELNDEPLLNWACGWMKGEHDGSLAVSDRAGKIEGIPWKGCERWRAQYIHRALRIAVKSMRSAG